MTISDSSDDDESHSGRELPDRKRRALLGPQKSLILRFTETLLRFVCRLLMKFSKANFF
jgi:hypothetical protein